MAQRIRFFLRARNVRDSVVKNKKTPCYRVGNSALRTATQVAILI